MTLERASELVGELRKNCPAPCTKAEDLFEHFAEVLGLKTQDELEMFAEMCGYGIIGEAELL